MLVYLHTYVNKRTVDNECLKVQSLLHMYILTHIGLYMYKYIE